jgi:tellurite resistance protein
MTTPASARLALVAERLSRAPATPGGEERRSILRAAAGAYALGADLEELTQPTGFDPEAARLFEALIESAFVVANADGTFDDTKRKTFERVVVDACGGRVDTRQVAGLLLDLEDQLVEDGLDKRLEMVGRAISRPEEALEVLRVAALLAEVSGGVSDVERRVMLQLSQRLGLGEQVLEQALSEASQAVRE